MNRKALIALIVLCLAGGAYVIFNHFKENAPDGDKQETVASDKSSQKSDTKNIAELILGKWEISNQNIGNTGYFSTLYNIKHSEIMEFFSNDNLYSENDNEYHGRVEIGTNRRNNWSLNSDGSKIVISDDIFEISFSEDDKQMTLTKPKENIKITLKRW